MARKQSIRQRLIIGFAVTAIITGVVGVSGYVGMRKIKAKQKEFVNVNLNALSAITGIAESQTTVSSAERALMVPQILNDSAERKNHYALKSIARIKNAFDQYSSLPHTEEESVLWKEYLTSWDEWMDTHYKFINACNIKAKFIDEGKVIPAKELAVLDSQIYSLMKESRTLYIKSKKVLDGVLVVVKKNIVEADKETDRVMLESTVFLFTVIVLSMALAVIIGNYISNSITKPINGIVRLSEDLSEGDLSSHTIICKQDETGTLTKSLTATVEKIKEIVTAIKYGSENLATVSVQVNASSQMMSSGASKQASETEEIFSSIEEMVSNIQSNNENAQKTGVIALNALKGIDKVRKATDETSRSVKEINQKITIIGDIAFQSNILALNAAVEAARAGEFGKGFSVVATEVRKLSERSKLAADEINKISLNSLKVSTEAQSLIESLIPEIDRTSALLQEIVASGMEQNNGATHISTAIAQINETTQQNATVAEQLASTAEELTSQADSLRDLIGFFKV